MVGKHFLFNRNRNMDFLCNIIVYDQHNNPFLKFRDSFFSKTNIKRASDELKPMNYYSQMILKSGSLYLIYEDDQICCLLHDTLSHIQSSFNVEKKFVLLPCRVASVLKLIYRNAHNVMWFTLYIQYKKGVQYDFKFTSVFSLLVSLVAWLYAINFVNNLDEHLCEDGHWTGADQDVFILSLLEG